MLTYLMVYTGAVLMLINIIVYIRFERQVRVMGSWEKERRLLYLPIVLLILFLIGYVFIGVFGRPDKVIASILFGGSIFVLVMVLLMQRITKRIEEEEKLRAALEAAEQANKAKTTFLSNMSHDIRTPLNAIIGLAETGSDKDIAEPQLREYMEKISASGDFLLSLINDILEMSRIESGKMELEEAPADLRKMCDELESMFAQQMADKSISFTAECDLKDSVAVCDCHRLFRVLLNLTGNAYKFTPEGGSVAVRISQNEYDDQGRGKYVISVKDTGIGMAEEFAEKVFDAFERERTSTVSGIQGTGLGMAITKSIIDEMGGTILVDTAPGKGTEFIINLSFVTSDEAGSCGERGNNAGDVSFHGKRVLVAEDVEVNRMITEMLLEKLGFIVETAENGRIAVDMIENNEPGYYDLVLMDIQMPEMDGYEATEKIRGMEDPGRCRLPVVAVTANAFREDVKRSKEAGMDGHISKPIDPAELRSVLAEALDDAGKTLKQ